jgi:S1-C subfamily serine protease
VVAALLATLAAVAASGPAPAPPAGETVVAVRGGPYHGSAIAWGGGRLLTALHVVEEMPSVEVRARGEWLPARVVDRDPFLDLALLEVDGALGPPPPVAAAVAGAPVRLVGCPGLACGAQDAEVLAPLRAFAGARYVELRGPVRPGASGGALLDASGALVGIVDLAFRAPAGIALAIPADRALARFPRAD